MRLVPALLYSCVFASIVVDHGRPCVRWHVVSLLASRLGQGWKLGNPRARASVPSHVKRAGRHCTAVCRFVVTRPISIHRSIDLCMPSVLDLLLFDDKISFVLPSARGVGLS